MEAMARAWIKWKWYVGGAGESLASLGRYSKCPKMSLKKKKQQQQKLDMTVRLFLDSQTETKINGLRIYLLLGVADFETVCKNTGQRPEGECSVSKYIIYSALIWSKRHQLDWISELGERANNSSGFFSSSLPRKQPPFLLWIWFSDTIVAWIIMHN